MTFKWMSKLHEWGAAPIIVPRSLILMVFLFVVVLTIGSFARYKAVQLGPIKCAPCSCDGDAVKPIFL